MLKICGSAIIEPLSILLNNSISQSMFPDIWKRSNIFPIHKKDDKQIISNYKAVSLSPICGKIFERIILTLYMNMLKKTNYHQCINLHLLSIVHNLYKGFDDYLTLETCGVFLDISKVFDKFWHQGLIFKVSWSFRCSIKSN